MQARFVTTGLVALGLGLACGWILAGERPLAISPATPGPDLPMPSPARVAPAQAAVAAAQTNPALGKLLFTDVARVYFAGPGHPANSDGTLGGLVAEDNSPISIYERFIVREATDGEGRIYRTLHPYETLGVIEQLIVPPGVDRSLSAPRRNQCKESPW